MDLKPEAKNFLVKYVLVCAAIDAIVSALVATLGSALAGEASAASGFTHNGTLTIAILTWVLTFGSWFVFVGIFMTVISFIGAVALGIHEEFKRSQEKFHDIRDDVNPPSPGPDNPCLLGNPADHQNPPSPGPDNPCLLGNPADHQNPPSPGPDNPCLLGNPADHVNPPSPGPNNPCLLGNPADHVNPPARARTTPASSATRLTT